MLMKVKVFSLLIALIIGIFTPRIKADVRNTKVIKIGDIWSTFILCILISSGLIVRLLVRSIMHQQIEKNEYKRLYTTFK